MSRKGKFVVQLFQIQRVMPVSGAEQYPLFFPTPAYSQKPATYSRRATLGTPSNFQWHAEAQVLHISLVKITQTVY